MTGIRYTQQIQNKHVIHKHKSVCYQITEILSSVVIWSLVFDNFVITFSE